MPVDRGGECLEGGLAARQSRFGFMLTRCAEEVADSNALPPALELLPVSLDILELLADPALPGRSATASAWAAAPWSSGSVGVTACH